MADDEQQPPGVDPDRTGGDAAGAEQTKGDAGGERRRRRLAATGWLCAVAAAFLLGAWSFAHADPGGQYGRPDLLTDDGVRQELARTQQRAGAHTADPDPSAPTSPAPSGSAPSGSASPSPSTPAAGSSSPSASGGSPRHPATRTSTVRFPGGLGTALAECRTDARTVTMLSWTPAEGYSADDVEPGPAKKATVELEPADDDAADLIVSLHCRDGEPRAAVAKKKADVDDEADVDDD